MSISNRYKDTFENSFYSSDPESLVSLRPINKKLHNIPKSKDSSMAILKKDYLNKNVLDRFIWQTSEIQNS